MVWRRDLSMPRSVGVRLSIDCWLFCCLLVVVVMDAIVVEMKVQAGGGRFGDLSGCRPQRNLFAVCRDPCHHLIGCTYGVVR